MTTRRLLLFKFLILGLLFPQFSNAEKNSGPVEIKIRRLTEKTHAKSPVVFSITAKVLTSADLLKLTVRSLEGHFTIKKSSAVKTFSGPIKPNQSKTTNVVITPQQAGKHTLVIDAQVKDKTSDQSKSFTEVFNVK